MKATGWIFSLVVMTLSKIAYSSGHCPNCGMDYYNPSQAIAPRYFAMPAFFPTPNYPPWAAFGAINYDNFHTPWVGGTEQKYFNGGGHVGMGKPNLYFSGPAGTHIQVKVTLPSDSNLLAAVPPLPKEGWKGILQADGSILVDKISFPYLFYDFRANETHLQDMWGFCVLKEDLLPRLTHILVKTGFRENEVKDFEEYWSVKMPSSEKYCVFPQETLEMKEVAQLEIVPSPKKLVRMEFIVVRKEDLTGEPKKFSHVPAHPWETSNSSIPVNEDASEVEVREWGVGFLNYRISK